MPAADTVWAIRKRLLALAGWARRKTHMIASISANATANANNGESTSGINTFSVTVPQLTIDPEARAEPTSPPIRAWEEDEGRPKYQVTRFQAMAPSRPASTITRPSTPLGGVMVSLTVRATRWPRKAPTKFITAAIPRATRGVSARVDTDVAIAFAASWKPLV